MNWKLILDRRHQGREVDRPRRVGAGRWCLTPGTVPAWWASLALCLAACRPGGSRPGHEHETGTTKVGTTSVSVTRPTVIAYFVIPAGAVDTLPELAVEADDWNVSMATLGTDLEANGIGLAIVTDSAVRVTLGDKRDTTIALGPFTSSGYVFVRPTGPLCIRRGGADADSVLATAREFARGRGCG